MTWGDLHDASSQLASNAELARRAGSTPEKVQEIYGQAATYEKDALEALLQEITEPKPRTISILAVSTAALYYKARQYGLLNEFAAKMLAEQPLNAFAQSQIAELLEWAAKPDAV